MDTHVENILKKNTGVFMVMDTGSSSHLHTIKCNDSEIKFSIP
jgi:hypothetical protein